MANVFGGGSSSSGSCGTGGNILQSPRQQVVPSRTVTSSPNVFSGESKSAGTTNLRDFYTKREIDKYLDTKADISNVYDRATLYTRSEVNSLINNLNIGSYALTTYVDSELADQLSSINNNLATNYYIKDVLYTRAQVDSLISALSITGDYISKTPSEISDVTIDPEVTDLSVSLLVRSSNNVDTTEVQRWENATTDYLGSIYADGKAKFVNTVRVGENVNAGGVGLELSERRISDVADPVGDFDAVNKHFMESFITSTIDQITQDTDENYLIDALEY